MAFSVRKTKSWSWTPFCTICGSSVFREQWWFTRQKLGLTERGIPQTHRDYHCILCRFNASVHLAKIINTAIDVYVELGLAEDEVPKYHTVFAIAEKVKESYREA